MILLVGRRNALNLSPQAIVGQVEMREAQHDGRICVGRKRKKGFNEINHLVGSTAPTILTEWHIEQSVGWAGRLARGAVAHVLGTTIDISENPLGWGETIAGYLVVGLHLLLEDQRQQSAQILVIDLQYARLLNVWWENGTICAVQAIALICGPVR